MLKSLVDEFADQLAQGSEPQIEAFLDRCHPDELPDLLRQLLMLEWAQRQEKVPDPSLYVQRFKAWHQTVLQAWDECFGGQRDTAEVNANETVTLRTERADWEDVRAVEQEVAGSDDAKLSPFEIPEQFGKYRILRRLGQGGMGTVLLAEDTELRRHVAIKVPSSQSDDSALDRMVREAQAAAALRHPHICPIYEIGTWHGVPFIAMAYLEGQPLSAYLTAGDAQPIVPSVQLLRDIALAVHEAHEAGVIHRDLKPSNIMIDQRGQPIVMDFGLASRLRSGDVGKPLTQAGQLMGTPRYMSPEQFQSARLGPATDIYSLGVMLFELLTGRPPFEGDLLTMLQLVANEDPPRLADVSNIRDRDLEKICARALQKKPERRFASSLELAQELNSWLGQASQNSSEVGPWSAVDSVTVESATINAGTKKSARRLLSTRFLLASLAVVAGVAALLWVGSLLFPPTNQDQVEPAASSESESPREAVSGSAQKRSRVDFDLQIWNQSIDKRKGLSLSRADILPLQTGDEVTVLVDSSGEPMYHYLVWIGSDIGVTPLYPWDIGDWELPSTVTPIEHLRLPIGIVNPTPATETALLLSRTSPLPSEFDLRAQLAEFPQPDLLRGEGAKPARPKRGLTFGLKTPPPEAEQSARFLRERLQPYFENVIAISFASGDTDSDTRLEQ